jgi:hypothetical protein
MDIFLNPSSNRLEGERWQMKGEVHYGEWQVYLEGEGTWSANELQIEVGQQTRGMYYGNVGNDAHVYILT